MRVKRARVLTSFILAWVDGETGLRARAHLHIETIAYKVGPRYGFCLFALPLRTLYLRL